MKKLSALLICAFLFSSCGYSAVPDHANVSEGHFSYEVDGCTFDYTSYIGCSRNDIEGVLKKGEEVICEYSASGLNSNFPEKVVNLFGDVYYIENRKTENHDTLFYIAKDGKIYPEFSDFSRISEEERAEQLEYISGFLGENLTEQEIKEIFQKCGYDDSYIIGLYNGQIINDCVAEERKRCEITEGNTDGCVFEYTEYTGDGRNDFEGTIKIYNDIVCQYGADCAEWNFPETVVHLFDDVYYIENRKAENHDTLFYIAKGGKMYPDFTETDEKEKSEQLEYISGFLRENMDEKQIIDIFNYCDCEESYIFVIYNYKGED